MLRAGPKNYSTNSYTQKSVGLDPSFGSSNFGVCITELVDGMDNVLHAEEYPRPDFNEMINKSITFDSITHVGYSWMLLILPSLQH